MKRRNRGQILVLFALSLVVLIGLAALGVDVGYMYSVRHELQRCADAGALAGASYFKETGYWSSDPSDLQMAIAEARARTFATRDNVITSPLNNTEVFVSFPENMRIRVGTQRTANLFFSRIFLGPTRMIRAYAVAEAFPVVQNAKCIVPWGFPAPWNDANNNGIFDGGDTFTYPDPDDPNAWAAYQATHCGITGNTMWDQAIHVVSGSPSERDDWLCNGSLQVLKLTPGTTDNTSTERVPGNFYGMDFFSIVNSCPGMEKTHGADFYGYLIGNSCECDFKASEEDILKGEPLVTKTGDMVKWTVGPVAPPKYYNPLEVEGGQYYTNPPPDYLPSGYRDGLIGESLMGLDPDSQWVDDLSGTSGGHPSSTKYPWTPDGIVPDGAKGPWWESPRIIKTPIYSPDPNYGGGLYTPEKGGKTSFKPLGFVGFWVQDIQYFPPNNGTIVGRFVTVPGEGMGSEPGPAGTQVLNIRLVE